MDNATILGKQAVSKDHILLGKIIRVDHLVGKTVKKRKPFAIVRVRRLFKKKFLVPIDMDKFVEAKAKDVYFDITHKEFDEEMKRIEKLKIVRESYSEYPNVSIRVNTGVRIPRKRGD